MNLLRDDNKGGKVTTNWRLRLEDQPLIVGHLDRTPVCGEISPCTSLRFPLLLTSDENRDMGFGDGGGDGLTALVMDARSGVGPACLVLREIGLPFGYTRLGDGADEVFGAKHIFGALP